MTYCGFRKGFLLRSNASKKFIQNQVRVQNQSLVKKLPESLSTNISKLLSEVEQLQLQLVHKNYILVEDEKKALIERKLNIDYEQALRNKDLKKLCSILHSAKHKHSYEIFQKFIFKFESNVSKRNINLFYVVKECLKQDKIEIAYDVANTISNPYFKGNSLVEIIIKHLEVDDIEKAKHTTLSIYDERHKNIALGYLVNKYIEKENILDAKKIVGLMSDEISKSFAWNVIAKKYLEQKNYDAANKIVNNIESLYKKIDIQQIIVQKYLEQENIIAAKKVAYSINDELLKSESLKKIVNKYVKLGQFNLAYKVARSMQLKQYKEITLIQISFTMLKSNIA